MNEKCNVIPYLAVAGAARALEFYQDAFDAVEVKRLARPDGTGIGHAEIRIEGSPLMLADEFPQLDFYGPRRSGGVPVMIQLNVEDVDVVWRRAIRAGARELRPLRNEPDGERRGTLEDPYGHRWILASRREERKRPLR
jgi:PhnB protein